MKDMSKLLIAQIAFVVVLCIAVVALGMEIFVGHMNPDVILPWTYVAAVGFAGGQICLVTRLYLLYREKAKEKDSP